MKSAAKDQDRALADRVPSVDALLRSHPLRTRIAAELVKQPLEPDQLADVLHEDRLRIDYHSRVLSAAGLFRGAAG